MDAVFTLRLLPRAAIPMTSDGLRSGATGSTAVAWESLKLVSNFAIYFFPMG
jgi:hypothetical protein